MTNKNDGGAAFPHAQEFETPEGWVNPRYRGMSLRDYFAAAALQGILSNAEALREIVEVAENGDLVESECIAWYAYKAADAMLRARKPKEEKDGN